MLQCIASILNYKIKNKQVVKECKNFKIDWDYFVQVASQHLVLPTVYCRLKARKLLHVLPLELEAYLREITRMNRSRNKALLQELQSIHILFISNGINYMFLKGMALLKGQYYNDIGERMIGDIDLLVHPENIKTANKLLIENGYHPINNDDSKSYFTHRHLPRLISDRYIGAVELHDKLLNGNNTLGLNPHTFLETKKFVDNVPIPSAQSLLQHNIMNFQINDNALVYGAFSLRSTYDTMLILEKEKSGTYLNINNLKHKITYSSYFYLMAKYFKGLDLHHKQKSLICLVLSHFFMYKMSLPKFNKFYIFCVNLIRYSLVFVTRLKLFLVNKAYRKDLLSQEINFYTHFHNFFYKA